MANNNLSRRDFLRGVAAGAVGMATMGVLHACGTTAAATEAGIYTPAPTPQPPRAWAPSK